VSASRLDQIRGACAEVAKRARSVALEPGTLSALARDLGSAPAPPGLDPAHHHLADDESTLAYVLTLDAINFGSGWFPCLRKRPGLSGYFTVATSLREHFEAHGPWDARALGSLTAADCARVLGQDPDDAEAGELMALFARALADLGRFLADRFDGRFAGPVEAAAGSAEALAMILADMTLYRDVSRYDELEVPFYKRAQLTAADLAAAFGGQGFGAFRDLHRLTLFADNLVPHVLRRSGVLVYAESLASRIDAGTLLVAGSPEEVEIRAVAVHAVEQLSERTGASPQEIDYLLWHRGQRPDMKAHPRHRARTPYY